MSFKVVYIDDEPGLCQIFEDIFGELSEIEIKTFVGPEVGLQSIASHRPDLVFLDYRLPNTTGVELANRVKEPVPMALVTGDIGMKLQLPFVKIFPKPFDFVEMEAFILGYINRKNVH